MEYTMNALSNEDLENKGVIAQQKAAEGIFEFAACIYEAKRRAKKKQGGSTFADDIWKFWSISSSNAKLWIRIHENKDRLLKVVSADQLPSSYTTISSLCKLDDKDLQGFNKEQSITPNTRTSTIIEWKNRLQYFDSNIDEEINRIIECGKKNAYRIKSNKTKLLNSVLELREEQGSYSKFMAYCINHDVKEWKRLLKIANDPIEREKYINEEFSNWFEDDCSKL